MYYNIIGDTMNNNGERINKYNETLIGFLNNLVNSLNPSNEVMTGLINDVTINFKKQLNDAGLDIADNGIKTLLTNAFNEYIKIIKYHFDHSDIHRIDVNHAENEDINSEVNTVTNNLTNAVNDMNKLDSYLALVNSIKTTLINYFSQTFPNKENVGSVSEEIVNNCIISFFTGVGASKAEEFYTITLPTLISLTSEIVYVKPITEEDIEAIKLQVNDERDAFIYETMDIEIKEGFENGVVTLEVTDAMGNTTLYEGREAMEKLVSYNQLFEASRPGKIADISKWEHLLQAMYEEDAKAASNPVEVSVDNGMNDTSNIVDNNIDNNNSNIANDLVAPQSDVNPFEGVVNSQVNDNPVILPTNVSDEDNSNSEVDDLLSKMNSTMDNDTTSFDPMKAVNPDDNGSIVVENEINDNNINNVNVVTTNTFNNDKNNNTVNNTVNNNEQVIQNFLQQHEAGGDTTTIPINVNSDGTNTNVIEENNNINNDMSNLASNALNSMINATAKHPNYEEEEVNEELNEIKNMIGLKEDVKTSSDEIYGSNFSFLPRFTNPNQDRNDFIKKATGITIEEDIDHRGELYLKVIEPTGREQIFTGKEAVNMIRNYNRTYLDANPNKKVDTSLIDKFD